MAEAEPDRRRKSEYAGLARVFAEKGGCKAIWEQKLEDWNVEESTVVNAWIARGEARGKEVGKLLKAQMTILRFGTRKFGESTEEREATIMAITDPDRLDRIMDRILDATDWDDLLATV